MSSADIRVDDEIYNMLMAWVANQQFAKRTRRFVANTNLNTRSWLLWMNEREEGEDEVEEDGIEFDAEGNPVAKIAGGKGKEVRFTPSFGTHYFWYKRHLLLFKRTKEDHQNGYGPVSQVSFVSSSGSILYYSRIVTTSLLDHFSVLGKQQGNKLIRVLCNRSVNERKSQFAALVETQRSSRHS